MSNGDHHSNPPRQAVRRPSGFGPAAIVREGLPSQDVHLLALFVAEAVCDCDLEEDGEPAQSQSRPFVERRQSPRFRAVEQSVWLGWWSTEGRFTKMAARLENISKGGAKLITPDPAAVQVDQLVWLCLGRPTPTECVQAKVLAVTPSSPPSSEGASIVRLAFGSPCPEGFYQAVIYGLAASGRD
jgi:hypothetical protein